MNEDAVLHAEAAQQGGGRPRRLSRASGEQEKGQRLQQQVRCGRQPGARRAAAREGLLGPHRALAHRHQAGREVRPQAPPCMRGGREL